PHRHPRSRPPAVPGVRGRDPPPLRRGDAGAGVPERDRPVLRGRDRGRQRAGAGMMQPEQTGVLRRELIGFAGIVERNIYLIRRFAWWELAWFIYTVANTLTIVFIAKGIEAGGGHLDVNHVTGVLLIGAVIWSYLGLIFEIVTETVAWERWEGTIE